MSQLENVAIAKALQYVARGKFEVAQLIRYRRRAYLLLIRYVTL